MIGYHFQCDIIFLDIISNVHDILGYHVQWNMLYHVYI